MPVGKAPLPAEPSWQPPDLCILCEMFNVVLWFKTGSSCTARAGLKLLILWLSLQRTGITGQARTVTPGLALLLQHRNGWGLNSVVKARFNPLHRENVNNKGMDLISLSFYRLS